MTQRLLTKHHLEFLSLKGGCTSASAKVQTVYGYQQMTTIVANKKELRRKKMITDFF